MFVICVVLVMVSQDSLLPRCFDWPVTQNSHRFGVTDTGPMLRSLFTRTHTFGG